MRYREFLLEYSREKTLNNANLMDKVMAAVKRKDPGIPFAAYSDWDNMEYVLDKFELIDPTPNYQYIQPLMNWYIKDKFRGFEDSHRLRDALTLFSRFKQRLDKRDINQYANINELEDAVEPWELELTKKEKRQQGEYHIDENSYELWKENASYIIVIPKNQKAACAFGSGTKWCTASTQADDSYFKHYNDEGHIYIIRTKDPNYDKDSIIATTNPIMQWHFESGQFMDVRDSPIELDGRGSKGRMYVPEALYQLFRERFINQVYEWVFHFFIEKSRAYDKIDFENEFPLWGMLKLMKIHKDEKGLEQAVSKVFEGFDFDNFYNTFDAFKEVDMFEFVRELSKMFINAVSKIPKNEHGHKGVYAYLQLSSSDRHTWWQSLKSDMRSKSPVGDYYKLLSHSKYDWDVGTDAKEKGISIDEEDKYRSRRGFIAKELELFNLILTYAPGLAKKKYPTLTIPKSDYPEFKHSPAEVFQKEYARTKHWLQSEPKSWMENYVIPMMLIKDGKSEEQIKHWVEEGYELGGDPPMYFDKENNRRQRYSAGNVRYLDPRVRNDTLATNTEWGQAMLGLV